MASSSGTRMRSAIVWGKETRRRPTVSSSKARIRTGRCRWSVRRLKARIWSTMSVARFPAFFTSCTFCHPRLSRRSRVSAISALPRMAPRMLLKSCAMPPASVPIASMCWECRNRDSSRRLSCSARSRSSALAKISPAVRSSAMSSFAHRFSFSTASKPKRPTRFPARHSGTQSQEWMPRTVSLVFSSLLGSA